ncbi:MAG: NADP-dependent glyceraldehyde-3-phosphate dehydrogenase, partial [Maribacter sp.]
MTIPKAYNTIETIDQRAFLVNGELRKWTGKTTKVFSTISSTDTYEPTLLGSIPD